MNLTDPFIGQQLGDYQIIDILGRGGMARVYRGYDARLERYAAVKVIDAQLMNTGDEAEYRQRFRREARAIANMRHPNIVGVYQFGEFGNLYYMAMVFIEGRDLGHILREHAQNKTRMTYGQVMRVARDIAEALDYAHSQGVIHRDIKPSNIMVMNDGHAILTDFGLALSVPEGSIGNTFGSAHYIAPEQAIASNNAVPQSDLYSLCVVIYQLLAGKVPFDDPSAMSVVLKHLREVPPSPSTHNSELGGEIELVLFKGLHKEPHRRYSTGTALVDALETALRKTGLDLTYSTQTLSADAPPPGVAATQVADIPPRPNATLPLPPEMASSTFIVAAHPPEDAPDEVSQPIAPAAPAKPPVRAVNSPLLLGVGIAALVLIAIAMILTISSPSRTIDSATATSQRAAAIASDEPSATQTRPVTVTPSPLPPSATASPRATDTPHPTATAPAPAPSAVPTFTPALLPATVARMNTENGLLHLIYDSISLTALNAAGRQLDLSGIEFVQHLPGGAQRAFRASLWTNNGFAITDMRPGECVQVFVDSFTTLSVPNYCERRSSWRAVSQTRWFWINDADREATFTVERAGVVQATCAVSAGTCEVDVGE
jgi:serine/threonine protein kinase